MVASKGWQWDMVDDDPEGLWKTPSIESFYLCSRWAKDKIELLDLGCGLGRHSVLFGKTGFHVHCFDISEDAILRTKAWAEREELLFSYAVGDMLNLPYPDASMDCILCRNVISHTDTQGVKQAISELRRVLKSGGECYLTLGSKAAWGFRATDWPFVDSNTKLRMEEGPEYGVPHFYADYELIKELFCDFNIIFVNHIEDFYEQDGKTNSSFHYHVLIVKT